MPECDVLLFNGSMEGILVPLCTYFHKANTIILTNFDKASSALQNFGFLLSTLKVGTQDTICIEINPQGSNMLIIVKEAIRNDRADTPCDEKVFPLVKPLIIQDKESEEYD
jgi:hypothetical protein